MCQVLPMEKEPLAFSLPLWSWTFFKLVTEIMMTRAFLLEGFWPGGGGV